jgi:hypothetical protein
MSFETDGGRRSHVFLGFMKWKIVGSDGLTDRLGWGSVNP